MASQKIVVRFKDGRLLKGHTNNFNPAVSFFHLQADDAPGQPAPIAVEFNQLKAVFFVRSFAGNPRHKDRPGFSGGSPPLGRAAEVYFNDGEKIVGWVCSYDPGMAGFFIFPADAQSNIIKAYVVASNVKQVRFVAPGPATVRNPAAPTEVR